MGILVMHCLVVCVDYDDFLSIVLKRNRRHFERTLVVTSPADKRTQELVARLGCECFMTDAFYQHGASFNKGTALEQALDHLGRRGWIAALDADVLLPTTASFEHLAPGCIYGATRYVLNDPTLWGIDEDSWRELPSPADQYPWANTRVTFGGHLIVFHADDPVLQVQPWFPTDWRHAGGYDSDFIAKWPIDRQKRLPFPVLHLGPVGQNWHGRITPRLDGLPVIEAGPRKKMMAEMHKQRQAYGYTKEKIERADQ